MTSLFTEPAARARRTAPGVGVRGQGDISGWPLACPECLGVLELCPRGVRCAAHGDFPLEAGIWTLITPRRAARYERFLREYGTVRRTEGRGATDPDYYRTLPYAERGDPLYAQWRIRAASFRAFIERVLEPVERVERRPLAVVDLGAGNGWLSHRLAMRGHRVAAVDIWDDERDGVGAFSRYADGSAAVAPIRADFDRLPLADGCADLVVFNASLHYTTDLADTLTEAVRVLRRDGRVVVIDSPVYRSAESGRRMVAEREASFRREYGFPSDALPSENWFTQERLLEVAAGVGISLRRERAWHGIRWALRPWVARARGRREPSALWLMVGERAPLDAAPAPGRRHGLWAGAARTALHLRHRVLGASRRGVATTEIVAGRSLTILPGVFSPKVFRTGAWLAEFVTQGVVRAGESVLDLGTGSGAIALAAAEPADRVVAIDLSAEAVRCARANAAANGLEDRVEVREGDLFGPLRSDERFDLVLFNPPFYRGAPSSAADAAWRSEDVPERFAGELGARLTDRGRALVVLSSDCDVDGWLRPARAAGLVVRLVARRDLGNEVLLLYRIAPPARRAR